MSATRLRTLERLVARRAAARDLLARIPAVIAELEMAIGLWVTEEIDGEEQVARPSEKDDGHAAR